MKKKLIKKALVIALSGAIFATSTANAASVPFSRAFVDSNQWIPIKSAIKDTNSELVRVKLNAIYPTNGSSSNYKRIQGVILNSSGHGITSVKKCWKAGAVDDNGNRYDGYTMFSVPDQYRFRGTRIKFGAMGNNPALDCRISGTVNFDYR